MAYDVIGNIAIFKPGMGNKKQAQLLLKKNKNIKTVLQKIEKVKGRLRTIKTKYLAGINTKETLHKENGCVFKLNVETCYFSPRLSEERKEIAEKISGKMKSGKVLVMFSGVAPYSIVIAKKNPKLKVVSIELGRECCKYARENVKLNKTFNVEILQGDVKKIVPRLAKKKEKFDYVVMPRPQLKDSFLKEAFSVSKKATEIFYYDFADEDKQEKIVERVKEEAEKSRKKIKILNVKKAGDIGTRFFRWRADLRVIN